MIKIVQYFCDYHVTASCEQGEDMYSNINTEKIENYLILSAILMNTYILIIFIYPLNQIQFYPII
jgi:hypothetical protein